MTSKIREALEDSNGLLEELALVGEWTESAREQIAANKAALAEPLRNCDVGTPEEQHARFDKFCNTQKHCQECPCYSAHSCPSWCALNWAQMPYEIGWHEGERINQ